MEHRVKICRSQDLRFNGLIFSFNGFISRYNKLLFRFNGLVFRYNEFKCIIISLINKLKFCVISRYDELISRFNRFIFHCNKLTSCVNGIYITL